MIRKTVRELADLVGGRVIGDDTRVIHDVCGLETAGKEHITFAVAPYTDYLPQVHAGAVVVDKEIEARGDNTLLVVDNPRAIFAKLLLIFHPRHEVQEGVHETAVLGEGVVLGKNVSIMPYAVIGNHVEIGDGSVIYPYVFIGDNAKIGEEATLFPGAVVHENCVIGKRFVARAHAVIGGEGFGFATQSDGHHERISQIGNVVIGDDVEVGAASAIDNGTMGSTVVKRGTKIDNLVHLGHNVEVGEDCFLIAQVGIAGSTKIGNRVILAGQTGCTGHITIADDVVCAGKTGITGNIKEAGTYAGFPVRPHHDWLRIEATNSKLPDMYKKIKALEKRIQELEKQEK